MKILPIYETLLNVNLEELYNEGKKYFPKLEIKNTLVHGETKPRLFLYPATNKGSFSINGFKTYLGSYKIDKIYKWLLSKGVKVTKSNTTNSIYFTLNNKSIRISDHQKDFNGIDIKVDWSTKPKDIADRIRLL